MARPTPPVLAQYDDTNRSRPFRFPRSLSSPNGSPQFGLCAVKAFQGSSSLTALVLFFHLFFWHLFFWLLSLLVFCSPSLLFGSVAQLLDVLPVIRNPLNPRTASLVRRCTLVPVLPSLLRSRHDPSCRCWTIEHLTRPTASGIVKRRSISF